MNRPIKFLVFKLKEDGCYYGSGTDGLPIEDYIIEELKSGYVIANILDYGIEHLKVITRYAPAQAKKVVDADGIQSDLTSPDKGDMESV